MEEFRIVFNLEIRERHRELWSAIGSGGTAEDAFWKRFRAQAHSDVAKDTRVLHAILRANFPGSLEEKLHDRLRTEFDPGPPRIDPDATRSSSRYLDDERSAERDEFFRALEKLRIEVKRIGSGSLELIVLVLGFTRFAELIGIDRDDFAKYFEIIAPSALNETFHTNVPLVADVTPTAASPPAATGSGGSEGRSGVGGLYVGFYLVPAIFAVAAAGAVLWVASAAFSGIATSLVEERKAIATNLHEEMKAITTERSKLNGEFLDALQRNEGRTADERRAVGEQLAAFLSKLTDTEQKKDLALDQAHKALFDAQMAFIGQANMGAKDRETAVVEFVKQRLTGSAAPIPPAQSLVPSVDNSHGPKQPQLACNLDRGEIRQLQGSLRDRGLFAGRIDGIYGPITSDALQRFQLRENIGITWYPDKATLDRLGFICNPAPSPGTARADLVR